MRIFACVLLLTLSLAGCGNVDWFPANVRQPTTPNDFSFTTQTGVELSTTITSDTITVSGLTAASGTDTGTTGSTATSPISITGSSGSNSKYRITRAGTSGEFTDAAGTVQNGDTVTVQHTSSSALGTDTISTLTIGDVSRTFTSTTKTVVIPAFTSATTPVAGQLVFSSGVILQASNGNHQISVLNGAYSVGSNAVNDFTTFPTTRSGLNGQALYLRVTSPAFGHTTSAHVTIDSVQASFSVTTQ